MKNFIIVVAFAAFAVWMGSNLINGNGANSMKTQMTNVNNAYVTKYTTLTSW